MRLVRLLLTRLLEAGFSRFCEGVDPVAELNLRMEDDLLVTCRLDEIMNVSVVPSIPRLIVPRYVVVVACEAYVGSSWSPVVDVAFLLAMSRTPT